MVEPQPSKLIVRVRFPSPALSRDAPSVPEGISRQTELAAGNREERRQRRLDGSRHPLQTETPPVCPGAFLFGLSWLPGIGRRNAVRRFDGSRHPLRVGVGSVCRNRRPGGCLAIWPPALHQDAPSVPGESLTSPPPARPPARFGLGSLCRNRRLGGCLAAHHPLALTWARSHVWVPKGDPNSPRQHNLAMRRQVTA